MSKPELKPCPFCGSTKISTGVSFFGGLRSFSCKACKCSIQFIWEDKEKCIEAWNRRADNGQSSISNRYAGEL